MSLADDGALAGGSITAVLTVLGTVLVWISKFLETRKRTRAMKSVPPSTVKPPGPDVDAAILARLQRLDEHQTLSAEIARLRWSMDDSDREKAELRREIEVLAARVRILEAAKGIADSLIHAKNQDIARLQEELTRHRFRPRSGVTELPAEHEYRDASQAGPLQDAIRTPLRPPVVPRKRRE